jgi:hypothetical protein
VGIVFVQRDDPHSRRAAQDTVSDLLTAGFSVGTFPEGDHDLVVHRPAPSRRASFNRVVGRPPSRSSPPPCAPSATTSTGWVTPRSSTTSSAWHSVSAIGSRWCFPRPSTPKPGPTATRSATRHGTASRARRRPPRHTAPEDFSWLREPTLRQAWFRSHGGRYVIRVLDQPGLWMTSDQLAALHFDLRAVAASAMDEVPEYGVFSGDRRAYRNRVIAVAYDREQRVPVAFTAMVYLAFAAERRTEPLIHLGLTMIARTHRGQRLQTPLFKRIFLLPVLNQRRLGFKVTNIAASPAGIGATSDYFLDVYPSYRGDTQRQPEHLDVARQILGMYRHEFGCSERAIFDPGTFVVHGSNDVQGGGAHQFIKEDPVSHYRVEACNRYCREVLDFTAGDELFQVGRVHLLWSSLASRSSRRQRAQG